MTHYKSDFLTGAIVGGLIGAAAGLLLAPKSGKDLCCDIVEGCHCLNEKGCELTKTLKKQGSHLLHPFYNNHDEDEEDEDEEEHDPNAFLVGGAIGAVIAAVAAILLAPKSGKRLREDLGDQYDDVRQKAEDFVSDLNNKRIKLTDDLSDWKDTLVKLANKFKGKKTSGKIDELVELASLGIRLFQQFKGGR